MMWITKRAGFVLYVLIICTLREVAGGGFFEVRLKSFFNDYGKDSLGSCCSGETSEICTSPCRTRFRVCLKEYQEQINKDSPCTFGDVVTPVLGENTLQLDSAPPVDGFNNPISFPFGFAWPGSFTLVIEAWHDTNFTSRSAGNSKTLIARTATQRISGPNQSWTPAEGHTKNTVLLYEFRVICNVSNFGANCTDTCNPIDNYFGHYNCSPAGKPVCLPGWQGDYCSKPICSPGCNEIHGSCEKPNECKCHPGWKGEFCDECERYPGCLHGTCQKPWDCLCNEGWGGLFCNQDLNYCTNHRPCHNNGTCFNTGQGSYTCQCLPGFSGTDCEREIDDCTHTPCQNGGFCKEVGSGFRCQCPKGWHGKHCETSAQTCDGHPCRHGGTCEDRLDGYLCRCPPGFSGVDCEIQIDDCSPNPCKNNGSCVDRINGFECNCPPGFTGDRCEINIDDCEKNPCLNGGSCIDLVNRFRCRCVPGFVGSMCQNKVDYCLAKPCANGGSCVVETNDYKCMCRPGFTGKDCSVEIDECTHSPCRNGGTCERRGHGFQCKCPPGYSGRTCSDDGGAGNTSRHVASLEQTVDSGLSHVVVIATVSTAVPLLLLVAVFAVMCMKRMRKREQQLADEEARMQNEANMCQGGFKRPDTHMIKNTWGKCINNVLGDALDVGDAPDLCYTAKQAIDSSPVYTLQQKQLNTVRASTLLTASLAKLDKELDAPARPCQVTPPQMPKRISAVPSVDWSLCSVSDSPVKRPLDKEDSCAAVSSCMPSTTPTPGSVFVINRHPDGLLATQV